MSRRVSCGIPMAVLASLEAIVAGGKELGDYYDG